MPTGKIAQMKTLSPEGVKIWMQKANQGSCIARVILIHGGNEHSGRHQPTIQFLSNAGIESIAFDLKGHGRNEAPFISLDDFVADLAKIYEWAKTNLEPKPTFLLGHSLGGSVALNFTYKHPSADLRGVILSSPALKEGKSIRPAHLLAVKVLSKLFPRLELPGFFSNEDISSMPEEVARYAADPLIKSKTQIKMAGDLLESSKKSPEMMRLLEFPLFLALGSHDTIINPEGCMELFKLCSAQDKTMRIYEGSRHEIHHDFRAKELFADLEEWIARQVGIKSEVVPFIDPKRSTQDKNM